MLSFRFLCIYRSALPLFTVSLGFVLARFALILLSILSFQRLLKVSLISVYYFIFSALWAPFCPLGLLLFLLWAGSYAFPSRSVVIAFIVGDRARACVYVLCVRALPLSVWLQCCMILSWNRSQIVLCIYLTKWLHAVVSGCVRERFFL